MTTIGSILLIGAVFAAIFLPIRLQVKHRILWRIGFVGLGILLVLAGKFADDGIWEAKRFDTVEEMAASCIPGEQLKDVIYYEDYAVLFCRNEIERSKPIYTTQRDEKGWKAYRRDKGIRQIIDIENEDDKSLTTLQLNDEGLDFICVDRPGWFTGIDDPEAFQHEVKDSEGNEFTRVIIKGLDMPIYYTFADADAPGYEVSIDGETLSISQTEFGMSNVYWLGEENPDPESITTPLIIGLVFLTGAILMGVFAYKRGSKGLIVGCVICGVPAFLFLVMAIGNWLA